MAERPILFSAPMVRAILAGKKTMTRRVVVAPPSVKRLGRTAHFDRAWVDPGPSPAGNPGPYLKLPINGGDLAAEGDEIVERVYPRWFPGDTLWVKETNGTVHGNGIRTVYRADGEQPLGLDGNPVLGKMTWRPSIFMRREYSRISLAVTHIRCERVQEISAYDVVAEGISLVSHRCGCEFCYRTSALCTATQSSLMLEWIRLWDSINGKRPGCSWDANPWVFVISFKRVEQEAKAAE